MAVNLKTREHAKNGVTCRGKVHPAAASISVNYVEWKKILISPKFERIIFVSLTVFEIFALIVDLSLT